MQKDKDWRDLSRSDYDFEQIIDEKEFSDLAAQVNLTACQRQHLIDSLYGSNSWSTRHQKFTGNNQQQRETSQYQQAYKKWKDQCSSACGFNETYQSTLSLLNKQKQASEIDRLMKQYKLPEAVFSYNQQSQQITNIKDLYTKELQNLISKNNQTAHYGLDRAYQADQVVEPVRRKPSLQKIKQIKGRKKLDEVATKQKMIELAVQKELLDRIRKINQQQREAEEKLKQERQLQKACFIQIINNPPPQSWKNKHDRDIHSYQALLKRNIQQSLSQYHNNRTVLGETNDMLKESKASLKQAEPRYKLNIESILQIPYKQFLIFYSENYRQILGLTSPEQMKKINKYRDQALQREEALQSLKKKVASYGPEKISQLPPAARQKLFRILYEKDVEVEKSYEG